MSATIDERVVEMKFDNKDFEKNVSTSLGTLDKLKQALRFDNATNSIDKINEATKKLSFKGIESGVESLSDRFSTLGIIGMTALQNLTNTAMNFATKWVSVIPSIITQGGFQRAMNIENARFQLQGVLGDAEEVELVMKNAQESVNDTAFGMDQAAKAASMFAASGIKGGEQMQMTLKALAGTTASFNADYESVANIFSTIAGNGRIMGEQLQQFSHIGMNAAATLAKFFKGVNDGSIEASDSVKATIKDLTGGLEVGEADIREFVSKGKIDFNTFSEAMAVTFGDHAKDANKTFNGALDNVKAALKRTGQAFYEDLIVQEGPVVNMFNSIRVKINEMNKAMHDFAKATTKTINDFVGELDKAIQKLPMDKITTVFVNVAYAIGNVFEAVWSFISPIIKALMSAFKIDISDIVAFSEKLVSFTSSLKLTLEQSLKIQSAFSALFNTLKIAGRLLTAFLNPIVALVKPTVNLTDVFFKIINGIRFSLINFNSLENHTHKLETVFKEAGETVAKKLSDIYEKIKPLVPSFEDIYTAVLKFVDIIKTSVSTFIEFAKTNEDVQRVITNLKEIFFKVGDKFVEVFGKIKESISNFNTNGLDNLKEKLSFLEKPLETIKNLAGKAIKALADILEEVNKAKHLDFSPYELLASALERLKEPLIMLKDFGISVLERLKGILEPLGKSIKNLGGYLWDVLSGTSPLETLIALINTKLTAAIGGTFFDLLNKLIGGLLATALTALTNFVLEITSLFKNFSHLEGFANSIKKIAEAILMIAGAAFIFASIPADDLTKASIAIEAMMGSLVGAMILMKKYSDPSNILSEMGLSKEGFSRSKNEDIGNTILKLAGSIAILAISCKMLADLDVDQLVKGIGAVSILLWELVAVSAAFNGVNGDSTIKGVGSSLLGAAIAVLILTSAVKKLSEMNVESLAQGVIAVGAILTELAGFVKIAGGAEKMAAIGTGLLITSVAVLILVNAVKKLAEFDVEDLIQGVVAIEAILLGLGAFVKLSGGAEHMIAIGLAMIEVGAAIAIITDAISKLAEIDIMSLIASVAAIGIVLAEIGIVLLSINEGAVAKAFSVIEMAVAIVLIGKTLQGLSEVDPESLLASVLAIGAILLEIGIFLKAVDPKSVATAFAAIEMAAAVVLIGVALKGLSEVDPESLLPSVLAIGAILLEMGIFLKAVDPKAIVSAFAAIEMAAAVVLIAVSLKMLDGMDTENILAAVVGIGLIIAEMALALSLVPPISAIPVATAFLEMSIAMVAAAFALKMLAGLSMEEILTAVVGLGLIIAELGVSMTLLGSVAPVMLAGAGVLFVAAASIAGSLLILAPAIDGMADVIERFSKIDSNEFTQGVNKIGYTLETLGESLKSYNILAKNSAKALQIVADALNTLYPAINNFSKIDGVTLNRTFTQVAKGISKFGESLESYHLLDAVKAKALVTLADAITKMAPALMMLSLADPFKIGTSMITLASGFSAFGKSLDEFGLLDVAKAEAIKVLAESIALLAPALTLLSVVDPETTATILNTLGDAFKKFGEAIDATPFWNPENRAEGIKILTDSVKLLAESLPALIDLDSNKIQTVLDSIGNAFKDFGEALSNAPFWNPEDRGEAITILTDSISLLAGSLPALTELDQEKTRMVLESIGEAFKLFGEALDAAPFWGVKDRGEAIKILVGSIKELADGLSYFINADFDAEKVKEAIDLISKAFSDFGYSLEYAPFWGVKDRGEAVATLVKSVKSLAEGLKTFINTVDADKVDDAITTIATAFASFGNSLKSTPWFAAETRADSIVILINNIKNLANGIREFLDMSGDDGGTKVKDILDTLGTSLQNFGEAITKTTFWNSSGRAESLIKVVNNLGGLVDIVRSLSEIGTGMEIQNILTGVGTGLGSIAESIEKFKKADEKYISKLNDVIAVLKDLITIDLTKLSETTRMLSELPPAVNKLNEVNTSAMGAVSSAFSQFAVSMSSSINTIKSFIDILKSTLDSASESFRKSGMNAADMYISGFTMIQGNMIATVLRVVSSMISLFISHSNMFNASGMKNAQSYIEGFESLKDKASNIAKRVADNMVSAIKSYAHIFSESGRLLIDKLCEGAESFIDKAYNAAERVVDSMWDAIGDYYENFYDSGQILAERVCYGFEDASKNFYYAGSNSILGFIDGIYSRMDDAYDAGYAIGNAAYNAAKRALDEHSPSRKMGEVGDYAGLGFINALSSYISKAEDTGEDLGFSVVDSLTDTLAKNIDVDVLHPMIVPEVDLTNVKKGANQVDGMFGAYKTMGLVSDISFGNMTQSSISELLGSIVSNTSGDDSDVVNSIESLRTDVNMLSKFIGSLKVVMDTGSLVGAIAPDMDNALGAMVAYQERGM